MSLKLKKQQQAKKEREEAKVAGLSQTGIGFLSVPVEGVDIPGELKSQRRRGEARQVASRTLSQLAGEVGASQIGFEVPPAEAIPTATAPAEEKKEGKIREQKRPVAPREALSPKSMRSIMAALKKSFKQFVRERTDAEKLANAPIPQIRAQQTDSVDEKKLETYLNNNLSVRDQLIALIREIPDAETKNADQLKPDVLKILKQNKELVFQLLFTAKTETQKKKVRRARQKKQIRAETKVAVGRATEAAAIPSAEADRLRDLPPPIARPVVGSTPATEASADAGAEGKMVEAEVPSTDGKHTPAGGEAQTVEQRIFGVGQDEADATVAGLAQSIPASMRETVAPFLSGLSSVFTGATPVLDYFANITPTAAAVLLGGFVNLPGSKSKQVEAIKNVVIALLRTAQGTRDLATQGIYETGQRMNIRELEQTEDSKNRERVLGYLQIVSGILDGKIEEGKASVEDAAVFDNITRMLYRGTLDNATPEQMRALSRLPDVFKKKAVAEALTLTEQRLNAALTLNDARARIIDANPEAFRSSPLSAYNAQRFVDINPETKGLDTETKRQLVFNQMTDGKDIDIETADLLAQSVGLGGVVPGDTTRLLPTPENRSRVNSILRGLSASALGALSGYLNGGSWGDILAGAAGSVAGSILTEQAGMSDAAIIGSQVGGAAVGAAVMDAVRGGKVAMPFKERPIQFETVPAKQIAVEQQEDVKNAANAIKASGTLKPKFIVPASSAFKPTPAEASADQVEFDMFDYIRPTSEGDGFTIAESNIKMAAYRNEQLRMNGGGMTYAPSWGDDSFDAQDEPINPRVTEAMVRGNVIPTADLRLPEMEEDFGDYEVEEHIWNPNVGLQRLYAPQPTPVTGLNTTINRSLLYGIVP